MADNLADRLFSKAGQILSEAPGMLADGAMAFLKSEELSYQVGAGAQELANALYGASGSGFVLYARRDHEEQTQAMESTGIEPPKQEHGMSM